MICDTCANKNYCEPHRKHGELIVMCGAYKKTPTNAEWIRAMSDESMAREIGWMVQDAFLYGCGERESMKMYPFENYDSTLAWLKSPAGGDGDV